MKAKFLTVVLILGVIFATTSKSHACPPPNQKPVAILTADPWPAVTICNSVTLDGNDSYDPDGSITKYEWDFDYDGVSFDPNEVQECPECNGIAVHTYGDIGDYTVMLRVTDDDDATGTDAFTVSVLPIYVPGDANTIQEAVNSACEGATIVVSEGTYYEDVNFLGKEITLTSADANDWEVVAKTIIDANGPNNVVTFSTSEDANSVLRGFTIRGGKRGIYCSGASPLIRDCLIADNNSSDNGGGIYCTNSASPTVTNCIFKNNHADDYGGGMYNVDSSPAAVSCIFTENDANFGGGIYDHNSSPALTNCTLTGNTADVNGGGMYNYGASSSPNVTNCIFWGDSGGEIINDSNASPNVNYCDVEGTYPGNNNIDSNPNFADSTSPSGSDGLFGTIDDGLRLGATSPCIDAGDPNTDANDVGTADLGGNYRFMDGDHYGQKVIDMGPYELPAIWYVDDDQDGNGVSWATAYKDLEDALSDANDGDEIWVAKGTYEPNDSNDRSASFELVEGTGVYGGFAGTEVARYQRDWIDNKTTLSGDIGTPNDISDNSYHVVTGADNAVFDGFWIAGGNADGNSPDNSGGGMYCSYASPTISNCVMTDNDANYGGGMYTYRSSPLVSSCFFTENTANRGGGAYHNDLYPIFENCVFSGNNATGGDERGGGMYVGNGAPDVINCTFSKNDAGDTGGGLYVPMGIGPEVTNCIFWANTADSAADQIVFKGQLDLINYCCIQEDSGLQESIVSHWKFDEGSGTTAYDSVGSNDGNLVGDPCWTTGQFDGALEFDGNDDYVDCGNDVSISDLSAFSLSLWFKTDVVPGSGAHPHLMVQRDLSDTVWTFILHGDYSGRLTGRIETSGTAAVGRSNFIPETGQWYHAVMTYDDNESGDRKVRVYVDGEEQSYQSQTAATGDMSSDSSVKVAIGNRIGGGKGFDGVIDDVRVYNRALSGEEVGQIGLLYFGEGNTDADPCFADVNNPDGNDGIFGTWDDGLRLTSNGDGNCIDAADGDAAPSSDMFGWPRIDINDVNNVGTGEPDYTDIGAYEYMAVYNPGTGLGYSSIQDAIDSASAGETIVVVPGNYEKVNFNGKAITLTSIDPNDSTIVTATVIDANDKAASYVATFNSGEGTNSTLDGFTITRGSIGILCQDSSSPTIANCRIVNNGQEGIRVSGFSSAVITNCMISSNKTGLYIYYYSSAQVSRSSITDNNGRAVYFHEKSSGQLKNCVVADNNDVGIYIEDSSATIINCTVANNAKRGIGLYPPGGSAEVRNCIVWGNNRGVLDCDATYSCIQLQGYHQGLGNFSIDPRFVSPGSNDFHLKSWSRCIDWGDPTSDYSKELEPDGDRINVGAYGNTLEAASIVDEDGDGLPDGWQENYWPGYDPNDPNYGPGGNPDSDDFNNMVEYYFGYEPNVVTVADMNLIVSLSASQFDPTEGERLKIIYLLNMDANVAISFTSTDTNELVRVLEEKVDAGLNQERWYGNDAYSEIVENRFYDVGLDANDNDGNTKNYDAGAVELYYVHDINNLNCNPRRFIPINNEITTIAYDLGVDANVVVSIYDPCDALFREYAVSQGEPNEVVWDGRNLDPSDPNSGYTSEEGKYRVQVKYEGMREKSETTVTVAK